MTKDFVIPLVAIITIAILTATALMEGIDTAVYISGIAAISGIGGYRIGVWKVKRLPK